MIHPQDIDRCAADGREPENLRAIPREAVVPCIVPRMKQTGVLSGLRVNPGEIRSFVGVAIEAGEGEILVDRLASMLPGDDVINPKRQLCECTGIPAILAAVSCALPDPFSSARYIAGFD